MKYFQLPAFVFLLFIFFACSKSEEIITMKYQMTQCADPWMQDAAYFNNKEATLIKYLNDRGVQVKELRISENCADAMVCSACICIGCDLATVKINAEDEAALAALGFSR